MALTARLTRAGVVKDIHLGVGHQTLDSRPSGLNGRQLDTVGWIIGWQNYRGLSITSASSGHEPLKREIVVGHKEKDYNWDQGTESN